MIEAIVKRFLIDMNEIWVSDISDMDKGKCDASEMHNRMVNASEMGDKWFNSIKGAVRFIKAHITL